MYPTRLRIFMNKKKKNYVGRRSISEATLLTANGEKNWNYTSVPNKSTARKSWQYQPAVPIAALQRDPTAARDIKKYKLPR